MASSKPGVVIVPGAWHTSIHFAGVTSTLQREGYEVSAIDLASVSTKPIENALAQDVAVIRQAITTFVDAGKNVVVIMHSYGGVCGTEAVAEVCEALKTDPDSSRKGHVTHLFCISAVLLDKGTTSVAEEMTPHAIDFEDGLMYHLEPYNRFYNMTSFPLARKAMDNMKPLTMETFFTPTKYAGWKDYNIPLTYLFCERDMALLIDFDAKKFELRLRNAELKEFNAPRIEADHSPWLSAEDRFMEILRDVLNKSV